MPLQIVRENIVHMHTDAIVNAANSHLRPGGGVCGSIFDVAGYEDMRRACEALGHCAPGEAVITPGFGLPARYVIHAVGPVWQGGAQGEERLLRACYRNCLELALSRGLGSIAFPLISSGIFGYPKAEALAVAVSEISRFLTHEEMQVFIVVYDARSFELSRQVFDSVASYIDDVYVDARNAFEQRSAELEYVRCAQAAPAAAPSGLSAALDRLDESFSEALLRLIDEKGMTDVEVYRRANIDRKHFSKIRTNRDYNPSKRTALALAVALRLTLAETRELLARAGFAISHSNKFDVVVEYFISTGNYDIFEINEALFAFDQPQLGG